jgi:3-methylfumaryl-CoA hydratase
MSTADSVDLKPLEAHIGGEFEFEAVDEVTRGDIWRKLEEYCFDCPLHYQDDVARAHGYAGLVAPATLAPLLAAPGYWRPGDPLFFAPDAPPYQGWLRMDLPIPYTRGVNSMSQWEYVEPLYPGDKLHGVWKVTEITPKTTRVGQGIFLTYEVKLWKQSGELVAVNRNTLFHFNPIERADASPPAPPAAVAPPFDPPPLTTPDVDWSRQRYFEDVEPGAELEPYVLWLSHQRIVMGIAADRMFANIHFDSDYARDAGFDNVIFNTRGYEGAYEVMLRRWMGLDGRLRKLGPFRLTSNGYPGDVLAFKGRVTGTEAGEDEGLVDIEIWVESPRGEASRGEARISLPRRS